MKISEVLGGGPGWTRVRGEDGNEYTVRGSISYRQNNPGNIRYGKFAKANGAVGKANGFSVFPSYEAGRLAKEALLFKSSGYVGKTLREAISRYAPPSENNTGAYVRSVAKAVGIDPDTKLSSLSSSQRSKMLDAMEKVEGYKPGRITDTNGNVVDPSAMAISRVPTPTFADRTGTLRNQADSATGIMSAINPATPVSVQRGLLGDVTRTATAKASVGMTPGASASGLVSSYRDPKTELADMQREANLSRQRLEMENGSLNLSQTQRSNAMARRDAALGILGVDRNQVAAIEAAAPLKAATQAAQTKRLADAYSMLGSTMQQGGVLGLAGTKIMDPNDILGVGILKAPTTLPVESMPVTTTQQTITEPVVTEEITATPRTTRTTRRAAPARTVAGGLLTPDEYGMVANQQAALAQMGRNKAAALKKGLSAFGGGVLGGVIGGPLGALLGGVVGPSLFNGSLLGPLGRGENYFPAAPKETPLGNGRMTDYGRNVERSSKQFSDAVSRGSVGLW